MFLYISAVVVFVTGFAIGIVLVFSDEIEAGIVAYYGAVSRGEAPAPARAQLWSQQHSARGCQPIRQRFGIDPPRPLAGHLKDRGFSSGESLDHLA